MTRHKWSHTGESPVTMRCLKCGTEGVTRQNGKAPRYRASKDAELSNRPGRCGAATGPTHASVELIAKAICYGVVVVGDDAPGTSSQEAWESQAALQDSYREDAQRFLRDETARCSR